MLAKSIVEGTALRLRYPDVAALARDFETNLKKGRAFVVGATLVADRSRRRLVIEHPSTGHELALWGEVVWSSPDPAHPSVGVELAGFGADLAQRLAEFVYGASPGDGGAEGEPASNGAAEPEADALGADSSGAHRNLYDRIRTLSLAERDQLARTGGLPERVALERCFGGSVWEGLLQNPQLTTREVARLAKSGSLPATLVNLIVNNRGWLADSGVQQALLQNPRVTGTNLDRVLRTLPQAELSRIAAQTSYRAQVRSAAKRLIAG